MLRLPNSGIRIKNSSRSTSFRDTATLRIWNRYQVYMHEQYRIRGLFGVSLRSTEWFSFFSFSFLFLFFFFFAPVRAGVLACRLCCFHVNNGKHRELFANTDVKLLVILTISKTLIIIIVNSTTCNRC